MKLNNTYYILRHGESLSNVKNIISCWPEKGYFPLTPKGRKQIGDAAGKLKNKEIYPEQSRRIDFIFASDLLRTKQTAGIVSKTLKIAPKFDKRLREYDFGIFNGMPIESFREDFPPENLKIRLAKKPKKGETYVDIRKRVFDFFQEINKKYSNKNILIISHEAPLIMLEAAVKGIPNSRVFKKFPKEKRIKTGELRLLTIY